MNSPAILNRLKEVRETSTGWTARCPAHDDNRASLSISLGDDGRTLVHCHAGCNADAIVSAVNLTLKDLAPHAGNGHNGNGKPEIIATYDYRDESGKLLYQAVRLLPKDFRQRRPKDGGGWEWNLKDVRRIPYRLPELLDSDRGAIVFVCEGEKDVDRLRKAGLTATTNAGGAGKWSNSFNEFLRDRRVIVLPDNDEPGRKHAESIESGLLGIASEVRVLNLPGLPPKGDVSDWLDNGGTVDELKRLAEAQPTLEPLDDEPLDPAPEWPVLDQAARYGLLGDLVAKIEPETESDPAALLVSLLVGVGNVIGRGPFYLVEGTSHHTNLFAVIVGATAKGRKGTSEGRVRQVLAELDQEWSGSRLVAGLVSGEGLVWNVRDPIFEHKPTKEKGRTIGYELIETDPGIDDKRLLVIESEFGSVLRANKRETSTLSTTIRQAWDTGSLRTLSKNSPARATGAHVSILGSITREELLRALLEVEAFSGFSNRFLWLLARRSRFLPDGGRDLDLSWHTTELAESVRYARKVARMRRDESAARLWREVYPNLSGGSGGLLGAVTSRAEAQVLRLSIIFALVDRTETIRVEHLQAALAVWSYCERSAGLIFGSSTGSSLADSVVEIVRDNPGCSRKDLHRYLGNLAKAAALRKVLETLRDTGRIRVEPDRSTGGRPAERYYPTENNLRTNELSPSQPTENGSETCEQSELSEQRSSGDLVSSLVRNSESEMWEVLEL